MLRIDITSFAEGIHHVELEPDAQALDLDPDRFANIRVDAALDFFNDRILVTLQASAVATLECDRTLRPFDQSIEGAYRILYAPPSFAHDREEDGDGSYEEVGVFQPSDREIDLTEAVRDTLLLAVPARKVAPGAEDEAIQTIFGVAANAGEPPIDPRWEALRPLRSDGGSS
ncbi:MAG: DUF177 domain-containing protein [Rhodothermales bacterium]